MVRSDGAGGGNTGPAGRDAAPDASAPGYLGHRARLRQRLVHGGPDALVDHELLEMVLFLALPRRDTKALAEALMRRFGSFAEAVAAPPACLDAVPGLGEAGVAALKAVAAAVVRLGRPVSAERPLLGSRDRVAAHLAAAGAGPPERPRVLFLDADDRLIADEAQPPGGPPRCERELVRRALELGAAVIVAAWPGGADAAGDAAWPAGLAAGLAAAAAGFGIEVRGHVRSRPAPPCPPTRPEPALRPAAR